MSEAAPIKGVHPLIKIWVLFHMAFTMCWSLPGPVPAIANGSVPLNASTFVAHPVDSMLKLNDDFKNNTPARHYLIATGLWQYWDMFAPDPSRTDIWFDAVVTYQSGQTAIVKYPRMYELPISTKYFKERYRKYVERINNDANDAWKRPAFAQRMALLGYKGQNDLPAKVELRRHFREIPPMGDPIPDKYTDYSFFTYIVDQEKIKMDVKP